MEKQYVYTGVVDKNDTEIKVGDVIETNITDIAVGKIIIEPFGKYIPGSFSYTAYDCEEKERAHIPLSVLIDEIGTSHITIIDSIEKPHCYTMEAKHFEKKLNDIGISYNQFIQLRKIWKELTLAAQAEVNDLLKQYEETQETQSETLSLEDRIDTAIQNELRYDTDNITNDGWKFLENEAPTLVLNKLHKDFEDNMESITDEDISECLTIIITEYEQTHANIRYYDA